MLGAASVVAAGRLAGVRPRGPPFTPEMLREAPSGDLFGLTQNVGMGWSRAGCRGPEYVIVSTMGGLRAEDGTAVALGYHTGHWEIGLLVREAAETLRGQGAVPFAAYVSAERIGKLPIMVALNATPATSIAKPITKSAAPCSRRRAEGARRFPPRTLDANLGSSA